MLAYRYTDWLADLTTNVSAAGVRRQVEVRSARPDRLQFVPNGLDLEHFRPDASLRADARRELGVGDRFVWLGVGRIEEAKDYPNLLRAMSALSARRPDALLLVVGQGKLEAEVRTLAGELGLAERVRFLGVRRDVVSLMNAADAYVMSSRWEGMPLVLQEAAAVGLAVVATDVGGNGEVVRHGESGYLVRADDPPALAGAMLEVMELPPARRHEMGQRGRSHVEERFGMEQVLDRWEALYRGLLEKKGVARCA
jgi:glycosyltransferase involved in cell wall biosynthesis